MLLNLCTTLGAHLSHCCCEDQFCISKHQEVLGGAAVNHRGSGQAGHFTCRPPLAHTTNICAIIFIAHLRKWSHREVR